MIDCSISGSNINYVYKKYSQADCTGTPVASYTPKTLPKSSPLLPNCQTRQQLGNPAASDDFISMNSQFAYAVYGFYEGENPPSTSVNGNLKRCVSCFYV
jgi:hypothetical protein